MGTHPIFESDFDCLTERQMSGFDQTENIEQELINMKHKITTAQESMTIDEIMVMQRFMAKESAPLGEIQEQLRIAQTETRPQLENILEQLKNWAKKLDEEMDSLNPPSTYFVYLQDILFINCQSEKK